MSTGGKERLGRITKMGDRYLRKLLVVGACAMISHRKGHNDALRALGLFAARAQGGQIQVQADGGGAGQQGRAHRLRDSDARRRIRRAADRRLKKGLPRKELSPRGDTRIEGDHGVM